ncbi:MAG: bPH 2 protein [Patescibacteria group bacterium]|nr:hypothetical protein [Candidatus Saccharibacteria bacterium]MDQ5963214.1 bPH 2 protein [Patescibacteria group bacterium]
MENLTPQQQAEFHKRLPINDDETVLGVYRHHWFTYFKIWFVGFVVILIVLALTVMYASGASDAARASFVAGGVAISTLVLVVTFVPVWLRMQEQMVVTNESLMQILQPSPFGSKLSQLSLQHVADVTVRKDFFGSILGFGQITVETPGEQKNYTFPSVSNPDHVTKVIIEAHENFIAALEAGRLPSNIGNQSHQYVGGQVTQYAPQTPPNTQTITPEEYQEFLEFKRAKEQYQQQVPREK